ncbi:MAG: ABC transporter permease [Salibaculum sp.]|uniref:ABC transporter permease n=1 Tax=Salibaculum sp. TaxID=2855480 RepID=UPI00286FFA05|nr:ABC transporter permease [Salibaculum sp.]MDR9427594.1 ABC transporter permease [Salibaculum sp.]MDR9482156.1 ABC transporter permease [Salibaculum sp.]
MDFLQFLLTLDSTLRLSTVLLLACLAGLFSERSGIVDIGLEGKMLISAFVAAAIAYETGSVYVGLAAGMAASLVFAMIHGVASILYRGDQIISGVALNFLASGLTVVVGDAIYGQGGQTPVLAGGARFGEITLPLADALSGVPVLGPIYSELISGHKPLVYVAFLAVPLVWWVLFRTRFGLRLRAVGENPSSVDTAGISVVGMRFKALLITGLLCGIAGAYLSTSQAAGFGKEMTAGRGYIALAALIFAKWRPIHAMGACLLFGLLEAVANLYPDIDVFGLFTIPVQFTQTLPYILTVIILGGFIGRAMPPASIAQPYVKER